MAIAIIASEALCNACLAIFAFKKLNSFKISKNNIKKNKVYKLFNFSINSFFATIGEILRFPLDNILISSFIGLSSVTIYSIPVRLLSYANSFILQSIGVMQPLFSQLYGQQDHKKLKKTLIDAINLSFFFGGILTCGLIVFGESFIALWVQDYEETRLLTYLLPISLLFGISQHPLVMVLYAMGKHGYYAKLCIIELILNLMLSLVLLNYWGIYGIAIGTLIPMFICKVLFLPRFVFLQLGLSANNYYKHFSLLVVFTLAIAFVASSLNITLTNWFELIIAASGFAAIYIALYFVLIAPKALKTQLIRRLKKS